MNAALKRKINSKVSGLIRWSQQYTNQPWYPFLLGFFAFIDNIIIIIPIDGLLVSSIILRAKRWLSFSLANTIGSSLGALLLAYLVEIHGLPKIIEYFPNLTHGWVWQTTENFFVKYGLIVVFVVAAAPIFQHPAIILAALANISLYHIFVTVLVGRLIKYLIMGYISSHAPRLLSKLWGLEDELEEVGSPHLKKT